MEMNVVIKSVVLGVFVAASMALAEPEATKHSSKAPTDSNNPIKRPEGKWEIDRYVGLLSILFDQPVQTLNRTYKEKLPSALQDLKKGDESGMATILAELFPTRTVTQKEKIRDISQSLRDKKELEDTTDHDAIALLDRLIWASTGLLDKDGKVKTEKSEKFNVAFFGEEGSKDPAKQGALAQREQGLVKEFLDLVAIANDKNRTKTDIKNAKEKLRGLVARDAVMSWVQGQLDAGNIDNAMGVVEAISWGDKNGTGERFVEFFNGRDTDRLYLGKTRDSMRAALKAYEQDRDLHRATLARKEHEQAVPREFMLGTEGRLAQGRPAGVAAPKALGHSSGGSSSATSTKTASTSKQPARPSVRQSDKPAARVADRPRQRQRRPRFVSVNRPKPKPAEGSSAKPGNGASLADTKCLGCHSKSELSDTAEAIKRISSEDMPKVEMGKDGNGRKVEELTQSEKDSLIAFFKAGGF